MGGAGVVKSRMRVVTGGGVREDIAGIPARSGCWTGGSRGARSDPDGNGLVVAEGLFRVPCRLGLAVACWESGC